MHSCYFDIGRVDHFLKLIPVVSIRKTHAPFAGIVGATNAPPCFLVVCGNSGCCKTSTVQLLCAEEGVEVVSWSEDMWEASATRTPNSTATDNFAGIWPDSSRNKPQFQHTLYDTAVGTGYSSTARDLFRIDGVTSGAWTNKVIANWPMSSQVLIKSIL
jgi:hypothetical protein